jgi:hypothetical protein
MPMAKPHKSDISIGPDRWITFIDLDLSGPAPTDIDHLIEPMWPFWKALETECVAECCGIDAFILWPEEIRRAAREVGDPDLPGKIIVLRAFVAGSSGESFISSKLNNLFRRSVLLEVLDHVADNVKDPDRGHGTASH